MKLSILAAVLAVALAGCGGTAVTAHKVANDPRAQRDAAKAQRIVKACAVKSNMLTKAGRAKFVACVAPAGKQEAVKLCAKNSAVQHNLLRKKGRSEFYADVERCILR